VPLPTVLPALDAGALGVRLGRVTLVRAVDSESPLAATPGDTVPGPTETPGALVMPDGDAEDGDQDGDQDDDQ
jgi:hypothetical protein